MKENQNLKNKLKKGACVLLACTFIGSFSGCTPKEMAANEQYDIVEQNGEDISAGLHQSLNIPGESFKLETEYSFDDETKREWRITSDKFLYLKVYTSGLKSDTEVYIDNIHIDTSIKSKYAAMDGILQDSMDDRIHNTQMIGFPISNEISYYGVNAIEGCNQDFISGSYYGLYGYTNGSVNQRRFTESDYLESGVYANKIQIVYDLLVKGPNDKTPRNISVCTDFIVPVNSKIVYADSEGQTEVKDYSYSK